MDYNALFDHISPPQSLSLSLESNPSPFEKQLDDETKIAQMIHQLYSNKVDDDRFFNFRRNFTRNNAFPSSNAQL